MSSWINYTTACAAVIGVGLATYSVFRRQSGVKNIVGPPSPSWIFGNMLQLLLCPIYGEHEFNWQKWYGPVYRVKGCFGQHRLMLSDPIAFQYIVTSPHFRQAPVLEIMNTWLFGNKSVIHLNGDKHRRLRAALNVGFTASTVRQYQPVFEKVAQMRLNLMCASEGYSTVGRRPITVNQYMSTTQRRCSQRMVLGCSLEDLGKEFEENNTEIVELASSQSAVQIIADAIGARLPRWLLRMAIYLPTTTFKAVRRARLLANDIGRQIARDKMDAAKQGLEMNIDVFSLLLNPDKSVKTGKELSSEEVVDQTAILLVAGQETTATTLAFALLELARHQEFQEQLRAEIHSTLGTRRQNVAYDNMPLLNAFIKEVLRLYPAEALTDRIAIQDTVIPLSESIITSTGERMTQIPIQKGQLLTLAIASFQRLESRWGADAHDFRPSRWIGSSPYQGEAVGPYAGLLTFLGGPHVCLGYIDGVSRESFLEPLAFFTLLRRILEMQVIICELVGKFSFGLTEDPVRTRFANMLIPVASSGEKKSAPLCITRIL
ncbi:cytochrome P450 [Mycena epipterygia]|nr:cytochrome P450 [Mycena epipterygia]